MQVSCRDVSRCQWNFLKDKQNFLKPSSPLNQIFKKLASSSTYGYLNRFLCKAWIYIYVCTHKYTVFLGNEATAHSGAKSKSCGQNQKNDFFSFRLKLIPQNSKLFVDLSMYNIFVLQVNLSHTLCVKEKSFWRFSATCEFNENLLREYYNEALLM